MTQSTSYLVRNIVALFIDNFCFMDNYEKIDDIIVFIENNFLRLLFKLCNDKISNVIINYAY